MERTYKRHPSVTDEEWATMVRTSRLAPHFVSDDGYCPACSLACRRSVMHLGEPMPPPESTTGTE